MVTCLVPIGGVIATIIGVVAMREIRASDTPESGEGLAGTAIGIGIASVVLGTYIWAMRTF
jgi:uncharacterized membrane protein YgaE (UPF0421/DUF939 family)